MRLVFGFGINDCKLDKRDKAYQCWVNMLRRCYNQELHSQIKYSSYVGCSVSDDWKASSDFCAWAVNQKGFSHEYSCLDKDILVSGNKVYSPENCTFVPREVNVALTFSSAKRGNLPLGVTASRTTQNGDIHYGASVCRGEFGRLSKWFDTLEAAEHFYKVEKLKHLSYLADKYSEYLDVGVISALKSYTLPL